jgi:hypothetical protein
LLQVLYMVQANVNDSVVDCSIPAAAGRMGLCVNALLLLLDDTRLNWLNSTLTDVVRSRRHWLCLCMPWQPERAAAAFKAAFYEMTACCSVQDVARGIAAPPGQNSTLGWVMAQFSALAGGGAQLLYLVSPKSSQRNQVLPRTTLSAGHQNRKCEHPLHGSCWNALQ